MRFEKLNDIIGWGVFLIAALVYLLTIEPTVSFWDCGEFISAAYKLEVPHPPGAPMFMLVARAFSAFVAKEHAAMMVNAMSGLCSAFAVLFLFWSITAIVRRIAERSEEGMKGVQQWAVLASGVVGALTFTFTDTFWFSAVEGEVYAMSAMLTATIFWLILKWERRADEPQNTRYIVLIAFIIGLSIGVHLMNLLAIPALGMVYYFRKYQATPKGIILALIASGGIIIAFQVVVITGIFEIGGWFERVMVNSFGAPFNLGAIIYFLVLFGGLAYGIYYTHQRMKPLWNTVLVALTVILIGYSCYATLLIRSSADPPMDQNNPQNLITLVSYLKREQYGSRPLFYGQYWNAPRMGNETRGNIYMKGYQVLSGKSGHEVKTFQDEYDARKFIEGNPKRDLRLEERYVVKDKRVEPTFHEKWTVPFQRMYDSRKGRGSRGYKGWVDEDKFEMVTYTDRAGRQKTRERPQWWQNLDFYFEYQIGWMYWRYFLWNFAGRQNDVQGHAGSLVEGNWLSGIDFIDEERLGPQDKLPPIISDTEAYNTFYYIPIVLGLIGFFFQLARAPNSWFVVMILFLVTGIAIITYLNQPPQEPRERDYTYVGSFWAFAIWIGLGIYALYDAAKNVRTPQLTEVLRWGGIPVGGVLLFSLLIDGGKAFSYSLAFLFVVGFLAIGLMYLIGSNVADRRAHLLLAFLLGLPAPYILAKEGWKDNDRSDRYTARDFAKNYLASCEKNAVLFTNGDNDTFPLWYVQEVEEFRTDVRVVNLSLLNTDWYVDQMARKAYESEALPFGVPSRKYQQGTRDVAPLFELRSQIPKQDNAARKMLKSNGDDAIYKDTSDGNFYVSLKAAMDFMMNDANMRNIFSRKEKHAYIPSKRFFIDVPKEKFLEEDIVPDEQKDRIVDRVKWRLGNNQLTKNSIMTLCLLANFDWERPIYFSVTVGSNSYMGLGDYLQLEGLAYRFVPVKGNSSGPAISGGIHLDKMYTNLMDNFYWGNMDGDDEIFMNVDNRRMASNMRLQFANLASELNARGKRDSAKKVLEKCLEVMPRRNVPYERIMVMIARELYKAGADEKGDELARQLFDKYERAAVYYTSLPRPYSEYSQVKRKTRESYGMILSSLTQFAQQFGRDELQKEFRQRMQEIAPPQAQRPRQPQQPAPKPQPGQQQPDRNLN